MEQTGHRRASRSTRRFLAPALVVGIAAMLSGVLVWRGAGAAFTASATNGANSWTTGTVALVDNDSSSLMFAVGDLLPGQSAQRCIRVTYTGSVTSAVRLFTPSGTDPDDLGPHIELTIERGTDPGTPAFGNCTNFAPAATILPTTTLAAFRATNISFASGLDDWAPTSGETRDYRFTYTFSAAATEAQEGKTATATFTWEAQA